jgi:hypothetical protein
MQLSTGSVIGRVVSVGDGIARTCLWIERDRVSNSVSAFFYKKGLAWKKK